MLVTIFGDLARDPEDRIVGPVLTRLTEEMGIKPEAVRVALHRLRNDDWITSLKTGRTANHALTAYGRRESQAASALIYAAPNALPKTWQLALTDSANGERKQEMLDARFFPVTSRIYLAHGDAKAPQNSAVMRGEIAPGWMIRQIIPEDLAEQYSQLLETLRLTRSALNEATKVSAIETALLRCLIVHHWRRLVLRHPYFPPSLTGETWSGYQCRIEVVSLLSRLPRPSLAELQEETH